MTMKRLVQRKAWASYMNTGTGAAPVWSRIGEGFTDLEQTMKAIEYGRHYVHEQTERRDVLGYAPSIAYSCDVYTGDPVIERICKVTDEELTGSDAQVDIISVNEYEPTANGHVAYRRTWTIVPDSKGAGVEALVITGMFAAVGDARRGVFNGTSFTEDVP